jgi:hypothetical protein
VLTKRGAGEAEAEASGESSEAELAALADAKAAIDALVARWATTAAGPPALEPPLEVVSVARRGARSWRFVVTRSE